MFGIKALKERVSKLECEVFDLRQSLGTTVNTLEKTAERLIEVDKTLRKELACAAQFANDTRRKMTMDERLLRAEFEGNLARIHEYLGVEEKRTEAKVELVPKKSECLEMTLRHCASCGEDKPKAYFRSNERLCVDCERKQEPAKGAFASK